MKLKLLVATFAVAFISQTSALSFQGQEELRTNTIMIEETSKVENVEPNSSEAKNSNGLSNQREEMRKMRLYILGALTEQLVAWFFQDIIPREVMQRTKRSLNVPEEADASYIMDAAVTTLGAILDRDDCRKTVVCNTCHAIKNLVPVTQVAVVVADHYLPQDVKEWDKYTVAKRVFLNDEQQPCQEIYQCRLDLVNPDLKP